MGSANRYCAAWSKVARFRTWSFLVAVTIALVGAESASAQKWAVEMFETTQHNFGNVPQGAKTEFHFKLKNTYKENVHIASARTSCHCTEPKILKADLKTYEEGAIVAEFNTKSFVGQRSAVITVVIDRPFYAEVQLTVRGNIRSDIVMEPGEVQFGNVPLGNGKNVDVKVSYQGNRNRDWRITDVRSTNQNLAVQLTPNAQNGKTTYNLSVRLKETAPAGELLDEIHIITNEQAYAEVTLPVRASVVPPLSIAPGSVELGSIAPGASVKGRVTVKADTPFQITAVDFGDDRFTFTIPEGEKKVHLLPFEFKAGDKEGAFKQTMTVTSNLSDGLKAEATVTGNVAK